MLIAISDERIKQTRAVALTIIRAPFTRRTWSELCFLGIGLPLAGFALAFAVFTMALGLALTVTFVGLPVIALSVRGARGIGGIHRSLARNLLGEEIQDPDPFTARPGFLGWLQSALRDNTGWRAMAYIVIKAPLAVVEVLTALSIWWDALNCLTYPVWGGSGGSGSGPQIVGIARIISTQGLFSVGWPGIVHRFGVFCTGVILLLVAPWAVRLVVYVDRLLIQALLAPNAMSMRVRTLEHARAQTVDASAATLRRIERDLHDGTQAQLVALAMRLGMAKEKLEDAEHLDLDQVRELLNDAHRGAKEAIIELRDLARGIHPPALDTGLEGALATLAARSTVPTELTASINDRPTPAIEAIAYFCIAELLSNVAQHANASRASISCAQFGGWLRLVVRDDGIGGAQLSNLGSSSSGLIGLTDRVRAVDGRLSIVSPRHGPTVVTVDLPLHA